MTAGSTPRSAPGTLPKATAGSIMPPPRFVVGTGRCGSTLLSRMLSEHGRVLNVFELFSGIDQFFRFQLGDVSGADLAHQLRLDHPMLTMVMKRGGVVPEVVYPFKEPSTQYALGDALPWALGIAIPRISDEPDRLFKELMEFVEASPTQPLAKHYRDIFAWLMSGAEKTCWIERSGGSIDFLGQLVEFFPGARFVHIHRDGPEAALSMREYAVLRVAVAVMNGLAGEIEYSHDGLNRLEREKPEAIDALLDTRPPIELYGKYWSEQIMNGVRARTTLPNDAFLDVRFEDLVVEPARELRRISDFFELPSDDGTGQGAWIDRAAALSRGMPTLRLAELPPDEADRLSMACEEAMSALGRR